MENNYLVHCQLQKKVTSMELFSWVHDMVMQYWSVDALFWQLSIFHKMDQGQAAV